jgi:acyl carrier protein
MTASSATEDSLRALVLHLLQAELGEWDVASIDASADQISPQATMRGDLGLDSLSVARVINELEAALGRYDLHFERLLVRDGQYVEDFTVGDLLAFLTAAV